MTIIKCGIKVTSKLSNITGIITATTIRFNAVAYEFSYFHAGEYKQCWLNENEFNIEEKQVTKIGFRKN